MEDPSLIDATTLPDLKLLSPTLSQDSTLQEERESWTQLGEVPLTADKFGVLETEADLIPDLKVPGDPSSNSEPKDQASNKNTNPGNQRTSNTGNRGIATPPTRQGINWNLLATNLINGVFGSLRSYLLRPISQSLPTPSSISPPSQTRPVIAAERVNTRIPGNAPVPLPQTRSMSVPVTLVSTLPGGVTTRVLVYRPRPITTTTRSTPTKISTISSASTSNGPSMTSLAAVATTKRNPSATLAVG